MIKLYSTMDGWVAETNHAYYPLSATWELDALFTASSPHEFLQLALKDKKACPLTAPPARLLAPLQSQEVWAAGVTYYRSRTARMEESKLSGGDSFYDKVYEAERPELFLRQLRIASPPPVTRSGFGPTRIGMCPNRS